MLAEIFSLEPVWGGSLEYPASKETIELWYDKQRRKQPWHLGTLSLSIKSL